MKSIVLLAIAGYRRYVSPRKGFSCAHRVLAGGESCSAYGYRVIARFGVATGWGLLQRRLHACGELQRKHRARQRPLAATATVTSTGPMPRGAMLGRYQAGDCDPGCDVGDLPCEMPCDGSDISSAASNTCDALSSSSDCDCGSRKQWRKCWHWWRSSSGDGEAPEAVPPEQPPPQS